MDTFEITERELNIILIALACYADKYEVEDDEEYENLVNKLLSLSGETSNLQ